LNVGDHIHFPVEKLIMKNLNKISINPNRYTPSARPGRDKR